MAKIKFHQSSETNEWYTPSRYIESARRVMGSIDLDPASCEAAQGVVKATRYYTEVDDGLSANQPWYGNVWLNPPYGRSGPKFVARALEEYEVGKVNQVVLILNGYSFQTNWFRPLFDYPILWHHGRVSFWNEGETNNSPNHAPAIVYLGLDIEAFAKEFGQYGTVMVKAQTLDNQRLFP